MISQSGKSVIERFVTKAKALLIDNVTALLQQHYGIWLDGRQLLVEELPSTDTTILHTAKLLRDRLQHIQNALPANTANTERIAVAQLVAEQAFTILNRLCALRMCEERELVFESIRNGYNSGGFEAFSEVTKGLDMPLFQRYLTYLFSVFDELSVELPSIFNRFSPYGLVFPDEPTLFDLLDLINDEQLTASCDEQTGESLNLWQEDETIGWIYQYYNSLEERRTMRDASSKPRNSREMAVRNQFFTPEYIVRFLTDNALGRYWYEMTNGQSHIGDICQYMVCRPHEELPSVPLKEPTEIRILDPTCGSMHFGIYAYEVMEYIYLDAWDNQPSLLHGFRYTETRESFRHLIPGLILEHNLYGCEIDPRALQMAALSLWLRAQRSYSEMGIASENRPLIRRSNLILAEAMPGNKRMLSALMQGLDKPMQRLVRKVWDKMLYVGEAGLLIRMEKEIESEIEDLRSNWSKINRGSQLSMFATEAEEAQALQAAKLSNREAKAQFFAQVTDNLQDALRSLSQQLSEEEGYENVLFTDDAIRGFAFIELCQQRYDVILMNPPFGEGSVNTSSYLESNYSNWCRNLVCAFFIRMQEMLTDEGRLGAIFDRTVMIKSSYENFRKQNLCGFITHCADTGWGVLDASVETSTMVLRKNCSDVSGIFFDVKDVNPDEKHLQILAMINRLKKGELTQWTYVRKSVEFENLPNAIIGYYFDYNILELFQNKTLGGKGMEAKKGNDFAATKYPKVFYEIDNNSHFRLMYNGGSFSMFYHTYHDVVKWDESIIRADSSCNIRSLHLQMTGKTGFGKRGEILDAHVLKKGFMFTAEGLAIPNISSSKAFSSLSYLNSILSQYTINLYCAQHKGNGYVNILPMPNYESHQEDIEKIVNEIITIKRHWFSLDETNLEYHGLIEQMNITTTIADAINAMQQQLSNDNETYLELVRQNDDLWMDLANIEKDSDFRQTLNDYKSRRPYEELLSIDGASTQNQIDHKVMAQEIIQELVGIAFGRWDVRFTQHPDTIPPFGDVFDALPFMPVVSLSNVPASYPINIPDDGILSNDAQSPLCLAKRVREVIHTIWPDMGDDIEFELCKLIDYDSLQQYFNEPSGFFDFHLRRYTKSRRKAPIYWPVSSPQGEFTYWVYYPKLSQNTLPSLILLLENEATGIRNSLTKAQAAGNKVEANRWLLLQQENGSLSDELRRVNTTYKPNHDDGVPVTAAPLAALFRHRHWQNECRTNLEALQNGDYDWSHLAYAMFPSRIRDKARRDWCLALTHGLEELCENRPRERTTRRTNRTSQAELDIDE